MGLSSIGATTCIWSPSMKVMPTYEVEWNLKQDKQLKLLECDVILSAPNKALKRQQIIQFGQVARKVSNEDRCWTHVALVHRDGYIFEAVPHIGVRRISFNDYLASLKDCHVRARRLNGNLPRNCKEEILMFASMREGEPYSVGKAALFGIGNLTPIQPKFDKMKINSRHHCASFVGASFLKGGVTVCNNTRSPLPVPATFSLSSYFVDVPLF